MSKPLNKVVRQMAKVRQERGELEEAVAKKVGWQTETIGKLEGSGSSLSFSLLLLFNYLNYADYLGFDFAGAFCECLKY